MKLLREYIRSLLVEQNTGISQEQEAAIATIYYVRSYVETVEGLMDMPKLPFKDKVSIDAGGQGYNDSYLALMKTFRPLRNAAGDMESNFMVKSFANAQFERLVMPIWKRAKEDANTAYGEDPMNAFLDLVDMISNENFETGMSVEEAIRVMGMKTDIRKTAQEIDRLIKTDNNVIALLDALAMV